MPTFFAGTDGRVKEGTSGGGSAVAGLTKWGFKQTAATFDGTHFESAADSNGNIHKELVVGGRTSNSAAVGAKVGIITNEVTLEGRLDGNTSSGTFARLYIGAAVTLDLIFNKTSNAGLYGLNAVIKEFTTTTDIKGTDATPFTATAELSGVPAGLGTARV